MIKSISSENYRQLTIWLKKHREAKGFSMRDLASRMDKPHSFVQKIESGERRLDVLEYHSYCKILGVDPHEGLNVLDS